MCVPGVHMEPLYGSLNFVPSMPVLLLPQGQHQTNRYRGISGFSKTSSRHGDYRERPVKSIMQVFLQDSVVRERNSTALKLSDLP